MTRILLDIVLGLFEVPPFGFVLQYLVLGFNMRQLAADPAKICRGSWRISSFSICIEHAVKMSDPEKYLAGSGKSISAVYCIRYVRRSGCVYQRAGAAFVEKWQTPPGCSSDAERGGSPRVQVRRRCKHQGHGRESLGKNPQSGESRQEDRPQGFSEYQKGG